MRPLFKYFWNNNNIYRIPPGRYMNDIFARERKKKHREWNTSTKVLGYYQSINQPTNKSLIWGSSKKGGIL